MTFPLESNSASSSGEANSAFGIDMGNKFDTQINQWFEFLKGSLSNTFLGEYANSVIAGILLIPILLISSYILSFFFKLLFLRYFLNYLKSKTRYRQDKKNRESIDRISKSIFPLFALLATRLSLVPLEYLFGFELVFIRKSVNAALILVITIFFKRIIVVLLDIWESRFRHKKNVTTMQLIPLISGASTVVLLAFGILFAISSLGIDTAPLVASLGALTFAIGFAVKDALGNFAAGVILILDQTFKVGDKIKIPGIGFGYVNEISLRTTRILTFDHEMIVVPNNVLMNKEYKNYGLPDEQIRVIVNFSVAYGSDIEKVKYSIIQILKEDQDILGHPAPAVEFLSMADFYLAFRAIGYINEFKNQYDKKLELTEKVYNQLNQEKIDIPFPTHTVHVKNE